VPDLAVGPKLRPAVRSGRAAIGLAERADGARAPSWAGAGSYDTARAPLRPGQGGCSAAAETPFNMVPEAQP